MTHIRSLTAILLFTAVTAFGQFSPAPPSVDPPDPTSNDPVTLVVQFVASCPGPPQFTRSGFDITVVLSPGLCLSPPAVVTQKVELGTLPAGEYHVLGVTTGTFSFSVLDDNPTVHVTPPIGSSGGGTKVGLVVEATQCAGHATTCPSPVITFGGVPAANVVTIDESHFSATTPAHAPGAVQVTVTGTSFVTSSYAFRYYDPNAAPSDKLFERVLVPVIFNGPGAFGSNWITEVSARNDNDYIVEPWHPIGGSSAIMPVKPLLFGSGSAPRGLFLLVPRLAAAALTFHAAVRNTSQSDGEWATEIPVAQEGDFSTAPVELLDIPADPRFRTMVRVYSPVNPVPAYARFVHLIVYSLDDGTYLREIYPSLSDPTGCSDPTSCAEHPSFASVADVTAGLPMGRVGIEIVGNTPLWGFATVTNNATQHVTVVSPQ